MCNLKYDFGAIASETLQLYNKVKKEYGEVYDVFLIDIGLNQSPVKVHDCNICVRVHLYDRGQPRLLSPDNVHFCYYDIARQDERGIHSDRQNGYHLQAGRSLGRFSTGTVGAICYDRSDYYRACLLTCNHIIEGQAGDDVYYPSPGDGGDENDPVGFVRYFSEVMDASVIEILDHHLLQSCSKITGTNTVLSGARRARIGDILLKSGRTTGVTRAMVDGIGGTYYPRSKPNIAISDCLRLIPCEPCESEPEEISYGGDSGAIWLDEISGEGVGLHLEGEKSNSPLQEYALATDLNKILELFNLTLTAPPLLL